ncbi:hypothetical protein Cni_G02498 [Canna indica]|uniref:Uncharacterized protein n=1 Tax=Canna indica TaxID=4628 RepID=A0AAQ3JRD5_9LILI|nr:hypothetical protein Cni_G02498 [Canna indica]
MDHNVQVLQDYDDFTSVLVVEEKDCFQNENRPQVRPVMIKKEKGVLEMVDEDEVYGVQALRKFSEQFVTPFKPSLTRGTMLTNLYLSHCSKCFFPFRFK